MMRLHTVFTTDVYTKLQQTQLKNSSQNKTMRAMEANERGLLLNLLAFADSVYYCTGNRESTRGRAVACTAT